MIPQFRQDCTLNFSATIRQAEHVTVVDVCGHLTILQVGELVHSIEGPLKQNRKNIVLNLTGLSYLDSSGIGELARVYSTVLKRGGEMKVIGLASRVQEVLKITGLYQIFAEFPDERSALQSFPEVRYKN
jgi:anti-sigma B factor antagonist